MSRQKIALITGAKEGIGFQTSLKLAARKLRVIMADKQDLQAAQDQIMKTTSNTNIQIKYLDLGSFKSIRKFVSEIKATEYQLDILINNAGIFDSPIIETEDNLDPVMQINHFGPFLLTNLLIDILKESNLSKIIFVASSGAFLHTLDTKELPQYKSRQCQSILSILTTYYNSKLCNMIISKELATRLKSSPVTSNCLHPGMTNTNFLIKNGLVLKYISPIVHNLIKLATQDVENSAELITFMATSNVLHKTSGKYFVNYQESYQPLIVNNNEYRQKVWEQAEKLVGLNKMC